MLGLPLLKDNINQKILVKKFENNMLWHIKAEIMKLK